MTILENGALPSGQVNGSFGAYVPGDELKIERYNGKILYYHNGALKYSRNDPQVTTPLLVDFAFYEYNRSIYNLKIVKNATTAIYTADVMSYSDYSPYGTLLYGRHGNDNTYRYGFQGQERDDEVKGEGNLYNFEYRMHDPRIGRFFAIDPLVDDYPEMTPYQFSSNRPIDYREIEGMEGKPVNDPANVAFNLGVMNSISHNMSMGLVGGDEAEDLYPNNLSMQKFYMQGQVVGDIASIFAAGGEITAGTEALLTAGVLAANIEGGPFTEIPALGMAITGSLTILHAGSVVNSATSDLAEKIQRLSKMENRNSPASGKGSGSQSNSGKKFDPKTNQEAGPSGKPKVHTVQKSTLKKAKDAARHDKSNGAKGTPVWHNKDIKGGNHYHNGSGVTGKGKSTKSYKSNDGKISNNVHYEKK